MAGFLNKLAIKSLKTYVSEIATVCMYYFPVIFGILNEYTSTDFGLWQLG